MAEKVTIKLEVNADTAGARKVQRELKKIAAQQQAINTASGMRSSTAGIEEMLDKQKTKWRKHFDEVDKLVKGFGQMFNASVKLATKGAIAEFALLAASMVGVHAVFAAGQGIMKAYRWALEATGAAASAMAIAITTAAAAIREQQAAMYAYKTTGMKEFGGGLNQTRVLMRGLTMDSQMAFVGVENLNKAFAAVSKSSTWTSGSQSLLRGLMDFAAAGQPIEQGVEKAGELIAALQETKTSWSEIKKAAEASSPAMKKALEEAQKQGINSREAFIKAINSGQLAEFGGVSGQFDAVSGTLINRLKQNFNVMRGQFADAGQQFLKPVEESLNEVFKIFSRAFTKTLPMLSQKGLGSLTEGIITVAEKVEDIYTKVIFDYAKRTEGIFEGISKWWNRFREGWDNVANALRPLIDGARVIEDAFMAAMQPIKEAVSDKFGGFNTWVQENRDDVIEFGDRVGKLIASIMKAIGKLGDLYKQLLPFINRVVEGLTQVTEMLGNVLGMFGNMGQAGSMFALMGMRQLRTRGAAYAGGQIQVLGGAGGGGGGLSASGLSAGGQALVDDDLLIYNGNAGMASRTRRRRGGMRSATGGDPFEGATFVDDDPFADPLAPSTPTRTRRGIRGRLMDAADRRTRRFLGDEFLTDEDRAHYEARGRGRDGRGGFWSKQMSNFTTPMTEKEMRELEALNRRPGFIGNNPLAQALRRQRARSVNLQKFQRSGGAQMGVGLGLGMLSSVAPAEMQGALALGGMAAQINPLLGLGVAGLGAAFQAQGAGTGFLAGGAGGAAVGAMVGGPVGAIIGAALGGVAGAIRGWSNKSKRQADEARQAVQATLDRTTKNIVGETATRLNEQGKNLGAAPLISGYQQIGARALEMQKTLRESLVNGQLIDEYDANGQMIRTQENVAQDAIRAYFGLLASYGETVSSEERRKMLENTVVTVEKLQKESIDREEAAAFMTGMLSNRFKELTQITGKSESQIIALATTLGVDLNDPMKSTIELTRELGHLQLRNAQQINQAYAELASEAIGVFKKAKTAIEAPLAADEAARNISDLISSGSAKDTDILSYLENSMNTIVAAYGDDTGAAVSQFITSFGADGRVGTAFTDPSSPLYGMEAAFNTEAVRQAMAESTNILITGMAEDMIMSINAQLEGRKQMLASPEAFKSTIRNLAQTNPEMLGLFTQAQADNFSMYGGSPMEFFRNYGINLTSQSTEELLQAPSQFGLSEGAKTEITELTAQFSGIFSKYSEKPEWMTAAFIKNAAATLDGASDTSTPRGSRVGDTTSSRLATTMNRHSVMDSMLTGKRTITSAWRNTNLGSMNSDHVTGRAYDLVGQNLGQYQTMVNSMGGFAEFHGVNGARHLHVVPGPVGDTAVPSMTSMPVSRQSGGSAVTNNYNINVSTNASDPEAVATFVMRKIEDVNRDRRERR